MSTEYQSQIQDFLKKVTEKNPNESEFLQAVREVAETVIPYIENNSFPEKGNTTKNEYDELIRAWIESNPILIDDFRKDRQAAHEKLYGPRKKG